MRAAWWWVDRWQRSTAFKDMTLAEQGAYRNLLDELWLRDGLLPADERVLARLCGDALEWPKVRAAVLRHFRETPEGYRNDTHDEVAGESKRRSEKQSRYRNARGNTSGNDQRNKAPSPDPDPDQDPDKSQNPPTPRKRGKRASAPFDWRATLSEFPRLDTEPVRAAVEVYLGVRSKAWTNQGMRLALRKVESGGPAGAVAAFEHATEGPWLTLWPKAAFQGAAKNGSGGRAIPAHKPDNTPRNDSPPKLAELLAERRSTVGA